MTSVDNKSIADLLENFSKMASSAISDSLIGGQAIQQLLTEENMAAFNSVAATTKTMLNAISSMSDLHLAETASSLVEILESSKNVQLGSAFSEMLQPSIGPDPKMTGVLSLLCESTPKIDISAFDMGVSPSVKEALLAVDAARPLLDESESPPPELEKTPEIQPKKTKWSRSDILSLLMLILMIISLLKSCADSSDQKMNREQNQVIITQNQTFIEQSDQSRKERQEIVDRLENAALALAEELDQLEDVIDDAEDESEISADTNQNDVQHDDANNEN